MSWGGPTGSVTMRDVPDPALDACLDPALRAALRHLEVRRPWGSQHVVVTGSFPVVDAAIGAGQGEGEGVGDGNGNGNRPDDRPVLVLVHGWPQHWFAWRHVMAELHHTFRLVVVDLRGLGWSSLSNRRADRTSLREVGDDLTAVLDALQVPRAAMAAHDWGGWIGFRAIQQHPDRFVAYAGLAIMPPWLVGSEMARNLPSWGYVFPMAAFGDVVARRSSLVTAMLHRSAAVPWWESPDGELALRSYLDRIAHLGAPRMTRHLYRSFVGRELPRALRRPRTGRLHVPATVIVGEHEQISRPENWWARTHAGEVGLVTIPDAAHWLAEEAPAATAAAIAAAVRPRIERPV